MKKDELKQEQKLDEYEQSKRNLKILRKIMIAMDVFAILLLFFQLAMREVSYVSYIILIICNIITFSVKPTKR